MGYDQVTSNYADGSSVVTMTHLGANLGDSQFPKVTQFSPMRGKTVQEMSLGSTGDEVSRKVFQYEHEVAPLVDEDGAPIRATLFYTFGWGGQQCQDAQGAIYIKKDYLLHKGHADVQSTESWQDGLRQSNSFTYASQNGHRYVTNQFTTNSDGKTYETQYFYPEDRPGEAAYESLERKNVLQPIETLHKVNGVPYDGQRLNYVLEDNFPRIRTVENYRPDYLPGNPWDLRTTIHSYRYGKPERVSVSGWEEQQFTWNANGTLRSKSYGDFMQRWDYIGTSTRLQRGTAVDGSQTEYSYDALGRLQTTRSFGRDRTPFNSTTHRYDYAKNNGALDYNRITTIAEFADMGTAGRLSALQQKEVSQYLDGLGRPRQTVNRQAHNTGGGATFYDQIVGHVDYDEKGRPHRNYNPFMSPHTDGSYFSPLGTVNYTETEYRPEPTNRPETVTPPLWEPTTYAYGHNENALTSPVGTLYPIASLTTQSVTDADDLTTVTYTDLRGLVVLVERYDAAGGLETQTWNVYDDRKRLVTVFPPGTSPATPNLIYQYTYDDADNLTSKKVPDRALEKFFYNQRNQLTYTQNSSLPSSVSYLATVYDAYGRVTHTGFTYDKPADNESSLSNIPNHLQLTETIYGDMSDGIFLLDKILQDKVWVLNEQLPDPKKIITTSYTYDDFGRVSKTTANTLLNNARDADTHQYIYDPLGTLLQTTHTVRTGADLIKTVSTTHCDRAGRPIRDEHRLTHNDNYGRDMRLASYQYDEQGRVVTEKLGNAVGAPLQTVNYEFLPNGFLNKINNPANPGDDLFALQLHYQDAPTGGTPRSNGNISGLTHYAPGAGAFTQTFTYDGLNRLTEANYLGSNGRPDNLYWSSYDYDLRGNITALSRAGMDSDDSPGMIDILDYSYLPGSNQIASIMDDQPGSYDGDPLGFNSAGNGRPYTYDASGNLTEDLSRNVKIEYNYLNLPYAFTGNSEVYPVYSATGQKLQENTVTDKSDRESRYYLGDMEFIKDELVLVHHGHGRLLPQVLDKTTSSGDCEEVMIDQVETFPQGETSPYAGKYNNFLPKDRTVYEGKTTMTTAKVPTTNAVAFTGKEMVKLEKGFASPQGSNMLADTKECPAQVIWQYEYYLKDHLGNTRVRFADLDLDGEVAGAEVLGEHHYYAFGLEMQGAWNDDSQNQSTTDDNRYRYNGKELNEELGLYDYGARWYDPAVARWTGVDALADDVMQIDKSPYAYGWNNPIKYDDPDGNCPSCIGFIVGAALDYGTQVAVNYATGNENPWTDVDKTSILVSGVGGATGAGLASLAGKAVQATRLSSTAQKVVTVTAEVVVDGGVNAGQQLATTGEVQLDEVAVSAVAGQLAGAPVSKAATGNADAVGAQLNRQAKRTERMARNTEARANPSGNQQPKGRMSKANRLYSEARQQRQDVVNHNAATTAKSVGSGTAASGTVQTGYKRAKERYMNDAARRVLNPFGG